MLILRITICFVPGRTHLLSYALVLMQNLKIGLLTAFFINNQTSCILEFACCLTDERKLKLVIVNTLNKSLFSFWPKQIVFFILKKRAYKKGYSNRKYSSRPNRALNDTIVSISSELVHYLKYCSLFIFIFKHCVPTLKLSNFFSFWQEIYNLSLHM